jgi:hypothetical protein
MATITGAYAALLGLLYIALSVRTLRTRRRNQIAVGDGGNPEMLRAIRVHGNFAEYAPFALLLIALLEINGGWMPAVHGLNLALLIGRCSHAYGVRQTQENFTFRVAGMSLTFTAIGGAAAFLLAGPIL